MQIIIPIMIFIKKMTCQSTFFMSKTTFFVIETTFFVIETTFFIIECTFFVIESTFFRDRSTFFRSRRRFFRFPSKIFRFPTKFFEFSTDFFRIFYKILQNFTNFRSTKTVENRKFQAENANLDDFRRFSTKKIRDFHKIFTFSTLFFVI